MKSYITVIIISALLLSTLLFALPKTEAIIPTIDDKRFDLNTKEEDYWKKEFIIELNIEERDRALVEDKVEKTKDVLYQRLRKAGVEEIQITEYEKDEDEEEEENDLFIVEHIKVIIQTTKDENFVKRMLASSGDVQIMKPREDFDILNQEDEMQIYLPENYELTGWGRDDFRSILINDLIAGDGQRSYFAIFRPTYTNRPAFSSFLNEHDKQILGVLIDSYVLPVEVNLDMMNVFAVGIGPDPREAQIQDIILNTGVIPVVDMFTVSERDLEPNIYEIDHIQISLAILVGIISIIYFLYQKEKEEKEKILQFSFSLLLIFSISLTVLKIWKIPVDLFLLIPTGILTTIYVKTMYTCTKESKFILMATILMASLMIFLGTGYAPILGRFLLFTIALSFLTEFLTKIYFKNIKNLNGDI